MIPLLSPRWHIDKGGWWERGGWRANVRERQALDGYAPKVHEIFCTWNSNVEYFEIGAWNPKGEDYLKQAELQQFNQVFSSKPLTWQSEEVELKLIQLAFTASLTEA